MSMINQIIRSNRRSLAITINQNGEVIVKAPKNMPLYEIMDFVEKKRKWIENKSSAIIDTLNKNKAIIDYEQIFYLGKKYNVFQTIGIEQPYITDNMLLVKHSKSKNHRQKQIKEFFLNKVENTLVARVQKLAGFMKLKYKSINILNSKAKWGMCDSKKNLYFNWKLLMLSPELIDYVIIHELSHLIELNHSPKFWEIVKAVLPNYKHLKETITKCGFLIKLF